MTDQTVLMILLLGVAAAMMLGTLVLVARTYRRVAHGQALIVNKMSGEPIVTFTGAVVFPIVHRAEVMDLTVKPITIARRGKEGVICADNLRADVEVTFYLRVNRTAEDVLRVAQAFGCARASDRRTLEETFTARFAEAIKRVARTLELEQLYTQRAAFRDEILAAIRADLGGYTLDDAAIDYLEQTPVEMLDPSNLLDARGLDKLRRQAVGAAAAPADAGAGPDDPDRFASQLRRLGLLDVRVTTEVACDVSTQRGVVSARLAGVDDQVLARLPSSVTRSLLDAVGRGELVCDAGRACFRWTSPPVTEAQLLAGARLVHAFRDDERAYR